MTVLVAPICAVCSHLHKFDGTFGLKCDAFPKGIPQAIIDSRIVHDAPYVGDSGIQFKQDPKAKVTAAELLEGRK